MTAFSYQLYSSRNFPPLADTLTMLADLGYAEVEGYGALYADPALVSELKTYLGASGLTMPTGHFGLQMLESDVDAVLSIAREVGMQRLYCPHLAAEERPDSGAGYEAFGRRLAEAARPYRDAGLGFGWHNHDFEVRPTADGAVPLDAIFAGGPDLEWEADIAWVIVGGADPLALIDTHGGRISAVHIKDIAPHGEALDEGGWADVGHGTVDWAGLMVRLRQTPCRHFIMEHDNPGDATRFARRSIEAARSF
ncbi:sugar phosphate isomerase/epimerase family protein [Oceaniradius stylonematis]|jgi:sugar phosphate isomerase/epimerase|uniref:sugar phosphate isomerase/epimerase family protein n=1 Tax=Oceaniradius stylonematis TaxID=2184161 RepID=UPI00273E2E98|nr:sugar phosphate isomerase/epimerase [Oceaniradius stylonematis]